MHLRSRLRPEPRWGSLQRSPKFPSWWAKNPSSAVGLRPRISAIRAHDCTPDKFLHTPLCVRCLICRFLRELLLNSNNKLSSLGIFLTWMEIWVAKLATGILSRLNFTQVELSGVLGFTQWFFYVESTQIAGLSTLNFWEAFIQSTPSALSPFHWLQNTWLWMTLNRHFALNSVLRQYDWSSEAWLSSFEDWLLLSLANFKPKRTAAASCGFLATAWLSCSSTKLHTSVIVNRQIGLGIPNMWLFLTPAYRSRDTKHTQWTFRLLGWS